MNTTIRSIIFVGMVGLSIVSMWTTYVSLNDSVLPGPTLPIPLGGLGTWDCSVPAIVLSVAIGMMLLGLKLAIIDEQKRLSAAGLVGLTIVAFISISFNMDVLYRTADRDFFIRYSSARMKQVYADYLTQVQQVVNERRLDLQRELAMQEGELEAEIQGLRNDPAGYGPKARQEDYRRLVMEKAVGVELEALGTAAEAKQRADALLATQFPASLEEIEQLQDEVRIAVTDAGAAVGLPLPEAVRMETPLFAVFSKLFDFQTVGMKEVFILLLAFFLDLGDIVGYSLVPDRPTKKKVRPKAAPLPELPNYTPLSSLPERRGQEPEHDLEIEPMSELFREEDEKPSRPVWRVTGKTKPRD